jgi:hypothetical protein
VPSFGVQGGLTTEEKLTKKCMNKLSKMSVKNTLKHPFL